MPEPFLDHLRMYVFAEEQRRRGVPQIVEADVWELRRGEEWFEGLPPEIALADRPAVAVAENVARFAFLERHPLAVLLERVDRGLRQGDTASTRIRLGLDEVEFPRDFLELALDEKHAGLQVDVVPLESEQLALSETRGQSEHIQRFEPIALSGGK